MERIFRKFIVSLGWLFNKTLRDRKTLHREPLIGCQSVNLFLPKDCLRFFSFKIELWDLNFWVYHHLSFEFRCHFSYVLLLFEFGRKLSCVTIFYSFLSSISSWVFTNWVFELSQFKFLSSVTIWVKLCHTLSCVGENSLLLKKLNVFKKIDRHFFLAENKIFWLKKSILIL